MTEAELITALDQEWELEVGFFAKLRELEFDEKGFDRLVSVLELVPMDMKVFSRALVTQLWYIPLFMEWQYSNLADVNADLFQYEKARNRINSLLSDILGVP